MKTFQSRPSSRKASFAKEATKRFKANQRERNRMHGLNDALDRLRRCVPLPQSFNVIVKCDQTVPQKLSKIETLRLAKNYIFVLSEALRRNRLFSYEDLINALSNRLSQNTCNLLRTRLQLDDELKAALVEPRCTRDLCCCCRCDGSCIYGCCTTGMRIVKQTRISTPTQLYGYIDENCTCDVKSFNLPNIKDYQ